MKFVAYDHDGRPTNTLESDEVLIGPYVLVEDDYICDADNSWVVNGELVATITPRPSFFWKYDGSKWVCNLSIEAMREIKWDEAKLSRSKAENSGFMFRGKLYDSDPISQQRIQGATQMASIALSNSMVFSQDWTTADNSVTTLDGASMLQLGMAMSSHINSVHTKGRLIREAIDNCTDIAALEVMQWGFDD